MNPRRQLIKLFWDRFFVSDWSSSADGLRFLLICTGALLVSLCVLVLKDMYGRYYSLHDLPSRIPYEIAVAGDRAFMILIGAAIAAFLCVLRWRSLYPDSTDIYVLSPMPVHALEVYGARLASVTICVGLFIVGISAVWAILFPILQQGHHAESWIFSDVALLFLSCSMAGFTVLFVIVSIEGALQLLLGRWYATASAWAQNVLLIALIVTVPQALRLFSLRKAIRATIGYRWVDFLSILWLPFVVSLISCIFFYGLSYLRRGQSLDNPSRAPGRWRASLLGKIAGNGPQRSLFEFCCLTLGRSEMHKTLFAAWLGVAAMMVVFEWTSPGILTRRGLMFITLAIPFWTLNGLVHAFEIPAVPLANWVFRILPEPTLTLANWRALHRMLIGCCTTILTLSTVIANWQFHTESTALALSFFEALLILSLAEILLARIDFIPFTAGYAPGQQPAIQTFSVYLGAFFVFVTIGGEISLEASSSTAGILIWGGILVALWSRLALLRISRWQASSLRFCDDTDPDIRTLGLNE